MPLKEKMGVGTRNTPHNSVREDNAITDANTSQQHWFLPRPKILKALVYIVSWGL